FGKGIQSDAVSHVRRCSRTACRQPAVFTLTYVYADSTAVLGPLAAYVEPHCYDLCATHADRLTAPRGWEVVRLPLETTGGGPGSDDPQVLAVSTRVRSGPNRVPRHNPDPSSPVRVALPCRAFVGGLASFVRRTRPRTDRNPENTWLIWQASSRHTTYGV